MTKKQRIANKEILIVLDKLNLLNKIPKEIILTMKSNQDDNWIFIYNDKLKLEEQKLTRQSIIFFSSLYYMYICDNNSEKEIIKRICQENEKKANEETMSKLNNLNKKNSSFEQTRQNENVKADEKMIELKKENFFEKLINKVKNFFKYKM